MRAQIATVMLNSEEPEKLVEFWSKILAVSAHPHDAQTEHIWLFPQREGGVKLGFQRVAKRVSSTHELHLDIAVDDLDETEQLVIESGGRHIKTTKLGSGFEWRILEDRDGNQFCIFPDKHM